MKLIPLFLCLTVSTLPAATLWVEGESATSVEDVHTNEWWSALRVDGLSGGAALTDFTEAGQKSASANYELSIPKSGNYTLWMRLASSGNGYAYGLDGKEAMRFTPKEFKDEDNKNSRSRDYSPRLYDETNLAIDAKTDARYYAWARVDTLELPAGGITLSFWLGEAGADKGMGGLDAFVLTTEPFQPNGAFRPGETNTLRTTVSNTETWAFDPIADTFSDDAAFDLRRFNEATAGQHGMIRLSEDGKSLVRGDGHPIRFWAGTEYGQRKMDLEALSRKARWLAKRGINLVRWHGDLTTQNNYTKPHLRDAEPALEDIDEKEMDQAFKLVAAMKSAGIYTVLSPYWGAHTRTRESWDLPEGLGGNLSPLVFFEPTVQDAYKVWLRKLYTTPNPYTGIPLKDDPAVAIIQLQNEDSMLFWTMSGLKGDAKMLLRRQFVEWLASKYGSIEKARAAWKDYQYDGDNWEADLPELFMVWEFTADAYRQKGQQPGFLQRRADQLNFFGETMYAFNAEMATFLREDLGCQQLINAGNWKTVDAVLVDDVERWSYLANEVVGKNNYFSPLHTGRTRGYQIREDHIYQNASAVTAPELLPTNVRQPVGRPFMIFESLWVPPNLYRAEGPLMVASQQSLNGVDAFFWFAAREPEWISARVGVGPMKWSYESPMGIGQFPVAALMYRRGDLKEAEPVLIEHRPIADVWNARFPLTAEVPSYDPNRDSGDAAAKIDADLKIDPFVFLTGPVQVDYSATDAAKSEINLKDEWIDRDKGIIRAATGEITIQTKESLYRIESARTQAAIGNLAANPKLDLGTLMLDCGNDYAAIAATSLDNRSLAESRQVLLQIGTWQRPEGWVDEAITIDTGNGPEAAFRIVDSGNSTWRIRKAEGQFALKNPYLKRAQILDVNGMPVAEHPLKPFADGISGELPSSALYLLLTD